jgi:TonB-linked SusC/RagA family outer membrane protein
MKQLIYVFTLLLLGNISLAQEKIITGTVSNKSSGTPLEGVTVQSGNKTSITDATGKFSIETKVGNDMTFSFVGMKPITLKIKGNDQQLSVGMETESSQLSEVVVTGYQTQRKADLTGAVSVVNMKEIKDIPVGNPVKALQGRVPGVFIQTDGSPGGGATVHIRGIGTLNNTDPLYVIDGIPTKRGLQEINPDDIESIQILKDASSATIYGARAGNGVIIVTTKKGKKGYNRINANICTSLQYYNTKLKTLDANGRGRAYWQAAVNDSTDPNQNQIYQFDWNHDYNNPILNKIIYPDFIDAAKTMKPANTKWFNEIAQTSLIQNYDVSMSNGGEKGNTLFSVSYYDNNGIVKESHSQKATARFNSDYNFFNNRLKVGENLDVTYIRTALIPVSDILFASLVQQPVVPVHTVDNGWGGPAPGMTDRQNPVRLIEDNKQNHSDFFRVLGNVYADLTIIPNLHFKTSYGVDYDGTFQRTLRKSYTSGFLSDPSNQVSENQWYDGNRIWQNTLNYNVSINKSKLEFLLGSENIQYIYQTFFGSRQGYALENIDYSYLDAGSSNKDNGGSGTAYALQSYFGKVNYSYDNKYLASATLRRDGSSRFGTTNRYGTFPAFSLGWRVSEEKFMKNQNIVSDLKLRYGYGVSGNQDLPGFYPTYSLYSAIYGTDPTWGPDQGSAYDITGSGSGQLPSGFTATQTGNDSLKWESNKESNFGLDFGLFNNKLTGSVDYFIKNTTGILISPGYLAVLGEGGNHYFNGASLQNKGLEILLTYNENINKDLSLTITGNYSFYRNKVTYLPTDLLTAYPGNGTDKNILGRPINSFFGYIAEGLFTSQKELEGSAAQVGKGLGRIRYKDLNGDGVIDDKDRDYIGDNNPKFLFGFNASIQYKNFDMSFFIQGVEGITVYNDFKTYTDFSSLWVGTNWGTRVLDAWTPENPNSSIPALTLVNRNNEGRLSTYFLEKGSYVKLRNLQIGYNLKGLHKNSILQNARIYIEGSNLFTIKSKSFTATDPENPSYGFPIPVIGTIGLNISL